MSDLIDFDSPNPRTADSVLASPLIPAPKSPKENKVRDPDDETNPRFIQNRRSYENNPFDSIMNKVAQYERNKKDPFERVVESAEPKGKSLSQSNYYLSANKPLSKKVRSHSMDFCKKNNSLGENISLSLLQSSTANDPLNDAFRKTRLASDSVFLNSQSCVSVKNNKSEGLNSYTSVSSSLSNISTIPMDSFNKEQLHSESSFNGIYNLSCIPSNTILSSDESVLNKAFINSRIQLNSASSIDTTENSASDKSNDKSDLIKKFYEIKKRMSFHADSENDHCGEELLNKNKDLLLNTDKKNCSQNFIEKLVEIDSSSHSIPNNPSNISDIIGNEANTLAQTLEKLAFGSSNDYDDDLLLSKAEFNFDILPLSDSEDENIDNLIDLPSSPPNNINAKKIQDPAVKENESSISKDKKALENEFIEQTDPDKKIVATTLLLDLQKIINKESNPEACKVLDDLQKILGVKCDSHTEILKNYFQNLSNPFYVSNNTNPKVINSNFPQKTSTDSKNVEDVQKNLELHNVDQNLKKLEEKLNSKKEDPEISFKTEKLAKNLLCTLNKIVDKKTKADVIDFLTSVGSILHMANDLGKKQNVDLDAEKVTDSSIPLDTQKKINKKSESPFKVPSQQKSLFNRSLNGCSTDVPNVKYKNKSPLLKTHRFSSDTSLSEKKKIGSLVPENKKPHLSTDVGTESIKAKFKKKTSTEVITQKGPLKAMIPLGRMQKQAPTKKKLSSIFVGPEIANLKILSSTPNSSRSLGISRSTPKASSTPNIDKPKIKERTPERRSVSHQKQLKSLSEDNLPLLQSNLRRSPSLRISKRPDLTPQRSYENGAESRLPRFSPRPIRLRNHSLNDLRTAEKSPSKLTPKASFEKKIQRHSVSSPLRNLNKLEPKPKNLISRFGRSSFQIGPEKENYV